MHERASSPFLRLFRGTLLDGPSHRFLSSSRDAFHGAHSCSPRPLVLRLPLFFPMRSPCVLLTTSHRDLTAFVSIPAVFRRGVDPHVHRAQIRATTSRQSSHTKRHGTSGDQGAHVAMPRGRRVRNEASDVGRERPSTSQLPSWRGSGRHPPPMRTTGRFEGEAKRCAADETVGMARRSSCRCAARG